jgi:hypothetical protein
MGLSTTDLGTGSGGAKTIAPGNLVLKINSLELEDFRFIDGAYHLILHVETEPITGFEGFMIDKDDESKGHYEGQIGRVKASQYAFSDGLTKSGIEVQRDKSILMFLQILSKTFGFNEWFLEQTLKHETINDFINALNTEAPFKDKYFEFCVSGKEYLNKTGYVNYDLWLPKGQKGKYAFCAIGDNKVITYDENEHLKKIVIEDVKKFGDDEDFTINEKTSTDFSLD